MIKKEKRKNRCAWVPEGNELYIHYHDTEWGVPIFDDKKMFEFLVLESAQAGLSWITVLRKREAYRKAFAGFNPVRVAKFTDNDVERLLQNEGIIRNRLKIVAAIENAKQFLKIQKEFGTFCDYMWSFVDNVPMNAKRKSIKEIPTLNKQAETLASDMKKRGFRFFGPTICYAHMQAVGMVNDHTIDCFRYKEVKRGILKGSKKNKK
ncbi:MAG: DNA-3-methyladenine glycosylase I [Parcubacteria group bacterium LiPW_41]|nr:MAG: DNA-3-methyladenine glycosylase I [Parcubacteria group bacterium LiPW_41]